MAKKLAKGLSAAIGILAVLLLLAAAWSLLTSRPDKPASVLGFSPMVVVSGSMEPEFPVGTFLLSRKVDIDQVAVGDIIVFYGRVGRTTGIITHRVVEKEGMGNDTVLTTKGDANSLRDPNPVTSQNLLGKVIWESPLMGKLVSPFQNSALKPLFLLIPAGLLAWEGVSLLRERNAGEETEEETEEKNI